MRSSNNASEGMNKLKQICKDTQKFEKKIIGKQFLVGKYFDAQKNQNKKKKQKKFTKSKIEKLLTIQQKIVGKQQNYEFYLPLHNLWKSYVADLLKNDTNDDSIHLKLLRADYHGALITVVHSKIDSYIGLQGIIINQSLKTFKIINTEGKIQTILKNEVIMQFKIGEKYFVINGNCLIFRSVDRTRHKFKSRNAQKINLNFIGQLMNDQQHV